jgi:seryl-tRNA synthetase
MHNIKDIRKDIEFYKKKLSHRNYLLDAGNLILIDKKNRELIQKKESLEQEKKNLSKSKNKENFTKSKLLSQEIEKITKEQIVKKSEIDKIISEIPNIALDDVPVGKDEKSNKLIKKFGVVKDINFTIKSHVEIGELNNQIDLKVSSKLSGSRFVVLKKNYALLERALSNFMLDVHVNKFNYMEISPPLIVNDNVMFGTGQLPKFHEDQFQIKTKNDDEKKYLIPTAEVVLTNLVREMSLESNILPLRFVACTPCFRKEAGSYGKDTKGLMRQHQFYKVELVSIVEPKNKSDELERMLSCAEEILKLLDIPYQVILLSTGDMGFSAEKTYDIEAWIPSEKKYREISSCSSCGSFQAKRMNSKYKDPKGTDFVTTLNGSGLAVGRLMIALIENYQNPDGSVNIPEVLRKYMNNIDKI